MSTTSTTSIPQWRGSNGGGKGWTQDDNGDWEMPALQSKFLDWLLTDPRDPRTVALWAEENGVHADSPKRWKRDVRFNAEWEVRAKAKNISTDRVQSVVDALHEAAMGGDVKAMQLYLQYVDRFTPKVKVISEDSTTQGLSDEELQAQLRAELASQDGYSDDPFADLDDDAAL